jgi:hypothetical protein
VAVRLPINVTLDDLESFQGGKAFPGRFQAIMNTHGFPVLVHLHSSWSFIKMSQYKDNYEVKVKV